MDVPKFNNIGSKCIHSKTAALFDKGDSNFVLMGSRNAYYQQMDDIDLLISPEDGTTENNPPDIIDQYKRYLRSVKCEYDFNVETKRCIARP